MNRLLLVDGNALFYRAFHAFPPSLTTPDGTPSNAAFGFTKILLTAIKQEQPTHLIVCFDAPGGTFRDALFDAYKATRAAMPEELAIQVPLIWELVDALEVPRFVEPGYEADDLIGTIARIIENTTTDTDVVILSGDQDLLQLVTDRVSVLFPGRGDAPPRLMNPASMQEHYGFSPLQMIDFKAFSGDSSDNIPGVPGVGPKTTTDILTQFGTLTNLYESLHKGEVKQLKPGLIAKLLEHEAQARTCYTLATIDTAVPVTLDLQAARLRLENPDTLTALFTKLGFKSLLRDLPGSHRHITEAAVIFGAETPVIPQARRESAELDDALAPVLRTMETRGVLLDTEYFQELDQQFSAECEQLRSSLLQEAGTDFNPDSPTQVADILYGKLGAPTTSVRKQKTGYTTDAETLEKLAPTYPFAKLLLEYRGITKLISTYIKPLPELVDAENRIHTTYAPDTATGRISSKQPNLQNIPIRSERGQLIRKAFIASPGMSLLKADYSQIELRVAAHLSGDAVMIKAFNEGRDFHAETAAHMGVDRHVAKIINFSILYGKGAYGFSQDMDITFAEAQRYITQYYRTFSGLKQWIDGVLEQAEAQGFVETWLGRRRPLPALSGGNAIAKAAARREAVNTIVQGTGAEVLKKAMVTLAGLLPKDAGMVLTVHDELVLEVPTDKVASVAQLVATTMEQAATFSVPLKVSLSAGKNWNDTEAIVLN
jgi:DNA polymerase I-like protein with 3'-5' exonuclease and polymerase domains/5'-3' exonuclease